MLHASGSLSDKEKANFEIKLNDQWKIMRDPYNYILCQTKIAEEGKRAGEEVIADKYFYLSLDYALYGFIRMPDVHDDVIVHQVEDYIKVIDDAHMAVQRALKDDVEKWEAVHGK
ncbi:hypothetical protein FC65_GL000651 [Ligilactobacillus acidipiscis DSM 15836]|uniref:Uncharacterized protein n=1 Tax=Ligilactobacillus acidipiscis DSM 15836 TaxID=1423716 RepID=A0ABR5PMQ2_9LACO|nr:hypothetical protein FC65_GL000651 [Ligilactobacillus acidipiscis DSM 15836]